VLTIVDFTTYPAVKDMHMANCRRMAGDVLDAPDDGGIRLEPIESLIH
jgi:hypothetical protein